MGGDNNMISKAHEHENVGGYDLNHIKLKTLAEGVFDASQGNNK
jgi:hypothetical protein